MQVETHEGRFHVHNPAGNMSMTGSTSITATLLAGVADLRPVVADWSAALAPATTGTINEVRLPLNAAREHAARAQSLLVDLVPGEPPSDPAMLFGQIDAGLGAAMGMHFVPDPGTYGWLHADLAAEIGSRESATAIWSGAKSVGTWIGVANDHVSGALHALDSGHVVSSDRVAYDYLIRSDLTVHTQAQRGLEALERAAERLDKLELDVRAAVAGSTS